MIKIEDVTFRYQNSDGGALENVSLTIDDGECILLCGRSGCGKTTLTRLVNGLIPHYYEGEISGKVTVNGLDVTQAELYETAKAVGSVFQNPRSQFFCVDTTSEIAFGCENIGMPEDEIHRRMKKCVGELKIEKLLGRDIFELSGGEKQKVACASVSALRPDVVVLDEPTSNLDMDAIEDLKSIIALWKSQGKTILIAEHRLYWLLDVCDRVIYMDKGKIAADMPMSDFRELPADKISGMGLRSLSIKNLTIMPFDFHSDGELTLRDYRFSYDKSEALDIKKQSIQTGAVVALIGHNGAGKSTLSRCLCGLEKKFKGVTLIDGEKLNRKKMLKKSYMVMQDVNHQLFCETVEDEVVLGMSEENGANVPAILDALDLSGFKERHPMSLSGGQKQRVAIASAILAEKEILIFDEPTSGLDFEHMEQTASLIRSLAGRKTILIVTHDPELIVRCATHIFHLESGKVNEFYRLTEESRDKFDRFFCK